MKTTPKACRDALAALSSRMATMQEAFDKLAQEIEGVADEVETLARGLGEEAQEEPQSPAPEPAPKPAKSAKTAKAKAVPQNADPEPPPPAPPPVDEKAERIKKLKQLQGLAQKAFASGKESAVLKLVKKFGLKSLSQIHPDHYDEAIKAISDAL